MFNCKEEAQISFSENHITTKNNTLVEIHIPKASGSQEISNKINTEIQQTVVSNLNIDNPDATSKSINESINYFNNEYNTFKNDFPESLQPWEAQIDGEVMYQSPEIISIAITSFTNTGGAHGNLVITFLNFNANTGERIKNNQLFNNTEAFTKTAYTYFTEHAKNQSLLIESNEFVLPANIGFNEDGLVLLYNTYEIAPYSEGIIEFIIPYSAATPYLAINNP